MAAGIKNRGSSHGHAAVWKLKSHTSTTIRVITSRIQKPIIALGE
jgi:hypothetical protein